MLTISDIKNGTLIQINNEPYIAIKVEHHKVAMSKAILKLKLKNLITGSIIEKTLQGNDKIEEAETEMRKVNFSYRDAENAYFMDNETFDQFGLPLDQVGDKIKFLKEGTDVDVLHFQGKPISIALPIKIKIKVTSAPPGVKGNSAGSVTKKVTLETGAEISAPLFIKDGDIIVVNTDTGEYVERA